MDEFSDDFYVVVPSLVAAIEPVEEPAIPAEGLTICASAGDDAHLAMFDLDARPFLLP